MAEQITGTQASTSGLFSNLLDKVVTTGTNIYTAKMQADAAKDQAKAAAAAAALPVAPPVGADWRATVAPGSGITAQPWFAPVAVAVVSVLFVGGLFLALGRRRK